MKKRIFFLLTFITASLQIFAQEKYTISGYISDKSTGEKLLSATVINTLNYKGGTTNVYGFYSLTLPKDSVKLAFSYIGFQTSKISFYLQRDTVINVELSETVELNEVEIVASSQREKLEERTQMSQIEIPIKQIKQVPALLGEVDVLKVLQLLPGVQKGGEGTSGLYVRGGSPDQNLILLDGVPVYNASHLFGFFSVFNADAIKDVNLIKGGFPARYGGRLSSVLEINMKEGNQNKFHGEGSIGLVASKITLEGPIIKNKTSFIISARRTYIDLLAKPLILAASNGINTGYYFYDLNAKVNHKFSEKDRLYFSIYGGNDKFYAKIKEGDDDLNNRVGWGNITSALRWNHLFNNKIFGNTTLTYSRYNFKIRSEQSVRNGSQTNYFGLGYNSGIEDVAIRQDFDFVPNPSHYIRFGANAIFHTFKPGATVLKLNDSSDPNFGIDTLFGNQNTKAGEFSTYFEDDWAITNRLKGNFGVHGSGFLVDKKFYGSAQPRVALRYLFPHDIALKGSFSTMAQFIHLLVNEGIGLPTDLWVPTTKSVKPETSYQAALGLAKTFGNEYEVSIEGYYKKMNNVLSYKEGATFLGSTDWQSKISQGSGESYGAEFFVQKKEGKFTGWIGYTLSWNFRTFSDINKGEKYPFRYDRRHDLSIVASYEITPRTRVSATWVFGTGQALSLPNASYNIINGQSNDLFGVYTGQIYPNKNNYRMPNYHRLDIGFDFKGKGRVRWGKVQWQQSFSVGTYNTYSRQNPFFLYIKQEYDFNTNTTTKNLKQVSLFPIIPYITYNFKF